MNRLRATKSLALAVGAWLAFTGCASEGYLTSDGGDEDGAPRDGGTPDAPAGDGSRPAGDATADAAGTKDSGAGTGSEGGGGQDSAPPGDAQGGDGESFEDAPPGDEPAADGTIADGGAADAESDSTVRSDAEAGDAADGGAAGDGGAPLDATTSDSAPADAATAADGASGADATTPADAASSGDANQPPDASGASDASHAADAADAGPSVLSLAAGGYHTCALFSDGTIKCWGLNGNGQLGDGFESTSAYPVQVKNLSGPAIAIGAGTFHTCAVISGGAVECWGDGSNGLLGNGSNAGPNNGNADSPTAVSTITNATAVVGGYDFSCALLADETVMCWGFNQAGEVGAGGAGSPQMFNTPQPVSNVRHALSLAAGFEHACVVTADTANVACWGNNSNGQLGPGTQLQQSGTPVRLTVPGASAATATFSSSCALTDAGSVDCWGAINAPPDAGVANLAGATQISGNAYGNSGVCAVVTGGQVACWGTSAGGTQIVPGLSGVAQVALGASHTCALLGGTNVVCWGNDAQGQLGDGMPATSSATPVAVQW
jgi:hypothetical protein